jgi:SAM-dependent methyltransferase
MKLTAEQLQRFEAFLDQIKSETYPETPHELHEAITQKMMTYLWDKFPPPSGARVLDVGCGQGVALKHFQDRAVSATGITVNSVDAKACTDKGFNVLEMDQSFLDFPDATFDLVWCRHCIEHSIFPYFTLTEFSRVLKPGGLLYLEVPAPDTSCHHESNRNHYSVLGKSMWIELCKRVGFGILDGVEIGFTVVPGPDTYWAIIARRP